MYHLTIQNITRTNEKGVTTSAVAKAAYRAGERIRNAYENRYSDFTHKTDVFHSEILLPKVAPDWMGNRGDLWNAVDAAETRKNSRLCREVEFALPRDIPSKAWIECSRELAAHFTDMGLVVDVAIHEDGFLHNPHVHMLLTTRYIDGDEFGLKNRDINKKTFVINTRKAWEKIANTALEAVGSPVRIDARSHRERGIRDEPTRHRGPNRQERLHRRIERNEHMRTLPIVKIRIAALEERDYYRDEKRKEFRAVDDINERIAFSDPRAERYLVREEERPFLEYDDAREVKPELDERATLEQSRDEEEHTREQLFPVRPYGSKIVNCIREDFDFI